LFPCSRVLHPGDREGCFSGTHHDPHGVLGPSRTGCVAFRTFRPYALTVTVVTDELRAELQDDGTVSSRACCPARRTVSYRLLVSYEGTVQDTEDAYRFLPRSASSTCICSRGPP